jgi:hypothetical protein
MTLYIAKICFKFSFCFPENSIDWKKSENETGFWARNCDFEGKSTEQNGLKADECFRQCEIENGKNIFIIKSTTLRTYSKSSI